MFLKVPTSACPPGQSWREVFQHLFLLSSSSSIFSNVQPSQGDSPHRPVASSSASISQIYTSWPSSPPCLPSSHPPFWLLALAPTVHLNWSNGPNCCKLNLPLVPPHHSPFHLHLLFHSTHRFVNHDLNMGVSTPPTIASSSSSSLWCRSQSCVWCPPRANWWTELQTVTEQQRSTTWPACTLIQPPQRNHCQSHATGKDGAWRRGHCRTTNLPGFTSSRYQNTTKFKVKIILKVPQNNSRAVEPSYPIRLFYKLKPAGLFL